MSGQPEEEAVFGILPVTAGQKQYGFIDALLVLGGYCIATWSYTQGSYLATLVGFKALLVGAFAGALLMLLVYQLPVILSVRYGIDIWIWYRAIFGATGVKLMTVLIIAINFPWYAVCAELFASSMENLISLTGVQVPPQLHTLFALLCVALGTVIALRGVNAITWTTRILVPLLIAVGAIVIFVGFASVPAGTIWNAAHAGNGQKAKTIAYILSIEANFAFVITLIGGMAEIPRLAKSERGGFWAGVLGQGLIGSFFVVIGAVMAIATKHVTGEMIDDPTKMLATLAAPPLALCSLLLVGFANVGTQAVGSYIYAVMLRSAFPKAGYRMLVLLLALYVGILCVWGRIIDYFGSFLTIGACVYAPLAALLFADFFFVRRQKLDLRAAFFLPGHDAYRYKGGVNIVGLACVAAGIALSLAVYNPLTGAIHCMLLFRLTPTGTSFIGTALLYVALSRIPPVRRYLLRDGNK